MSPRIKLICGVSSLSAAHQAYLRRINVNTGEVKLDFFEIRIFRHR